MSSKSKSNKRKLPEEEFDATISILIKAGSAPTPKRRKLSHNHDSNHASKSELFDLDSPLECGHCNKKLPDDDQVFCAECGDFYSCKDCWMEEGSYCAKCNEFWCNGCWTLKSCDDCFEIYCEECGDFKPGKGGGNQCYKCQPWWKKKKKASDFCTECGSGKSTAEVCYECGKRYCIDCGGISCPFCDEFVCDLCGGIGFCEKCGELCCENCEEECCEE